MVFCARRGLAALLALGLLLVGAGAAPAPLSAQEASVQPAARAQRSASKARRARAKAASAKKPKSTPAPEKPVEEVPAPKPASEAAAPTDAASDARDGAAPTGGETPGEVRTEGDTQVKMMEFSGLDIEGQLKTPQMLYFLNRLRAEFGRPKLPHRSFMPELQRGTQEQAQR
jgi:hypothetical protein